MRSALLLAALFLLLAGCGGKAVPIGELTGPDIHTRVQKSNNGKPVFFWYRLEHESADAYVIQGNADFQTLGTVRDARMKLYLVRDRKVVATVPLRVRATQMDKKVYYYKEFTAEEPFDYVAFGWHLKYRF
jgi:predicted small lipoprotein YifL